MSRLICLLSAFALLTALKASGQTTSTPPDPQNQISQPAGTPIPPLPERPESTHAKSRSASSDVGHGAADIGKGVGKGAGDLAKGTGKGAVDLVTLHPVNAAADLGKGAGKAGGHVAVGVAKGTGKIVEGTGKAVRKLF